MKREINGSHLREATGNATAGKAHLLQNQQPSFKTEIHKRSAQIEKSRYCILYN